MLLLGLTGSIATGKSTVSNLLSTTPYNLPIIDADKIAREVVEPGTNGYKKIVDHFSSSTPDLLIEPTELSGGQHGKDGKGRPLNRAALGRRVFGEGSEGDRKVLNGIVHPAVRREVYKQIFTAYIHVVAVSDAKIQMQRLRDRNPELSEEDANNRVKAQWDVRDKADRCEARGEGRGVVVWNDGDRDELKREVGQAMAKIRRSSPRWWCWLLLLVPPLAGAVGTWSYVRMWWVKRQWEGPKAKEKAKL